MDSVSNNTFGQQNSRDQNAVGGQVVARLRHPASRSAAPDEAGTIVLEVSVKNGAYNYRLARGAADAISEVHRLIYRGNLTAELSKIDST